MQKEVCWLITTKCNQNCKYCHRFLHIEDLTYEENEKILMKLIRAGVTHITFSGGEALLYPNILNLLKIAKRYGIKSKLITNGVMLAKNKDIQEICDYLDSLTLSIDSIDNNINKEMGRGESHFANIRTVLEYLKGKELTVNINTVVSKMNLDSIQELGEFLNNYNINSWRIFKFMPLRETAKENQEKFEISKDEFKLSKEIFEKYKNIRNIQYREEQDMEDKYVLIISNGDIMRTENGIDVKKGNALEQSIDEILQIIGNNYSRNYSINKIRTLIANNSKVITNKIIDAIKDLNYVEIVGTATDGQETHNKILDLQPEVVFAEYDMSSIDMMKNVKEELDTEIPVFNFFAKEMPISEIEKGYGIVGAKLNAWLDEDDSDTIRRILQEYKEYKYKGSI